MTDLAHLCHLAAVAVVVFREDGREEWIDYVESSSDDELSSHFTMVSVLAKAFLGLLALHPELKPRFPVQATSVAAE
jgi:hypothetical protein